MKFSPSFLDDIRSRLAMSSVVGRYVPWDRRKSNPSRGDWWACCPFHNEKTPSFHVEDRKGRYHCFGCKASGDIFTFLVAKEGVSFPEAVERLAHEAGLPMPQLTEEDVAREKLRASLYDVMELAAKFFEETLRSAHGAKARAYLADRGLAPAIQQEFRLGYAPDDRSALRSYLAARDITVEQMAEAGLVISGEDIPVAYDRFRDRVMFPINDARGRVIAFGGRALSKDAQAKYLNSPETPLFHKGRVLYNLDKARGPAHEAQAVIAVEGYMDTIAMHRAGLTHTVAPLGTALTEDQLTLLWRMAPEPTLCFDGDEAGQRAAYRAIDLAIPLLKPGYSQKFSRLPFGQDPDELLRAEGPDALRTIIREAIPLIDMLWSRLALDLDARNPDKRSKVESEIDEIVKRVTHPLVARHYRSALKSRFWDHLRAALGLPSEHRDKRPRLYVANKSRLNNVVNFPEWELISFAAISPQLILEFGERLGSLDFSDGLVDGIVSMLLSRAADDPSFFERAATDEILRSISEKGLGSRFRSFFDGTILPSFHSRIESDPEYIRESFLEKLDHISHKNWIVEEKGRLLVDFEANNDKQFDERAKGIIHRNSSRRLVDESDLVQLSATVWKTRERVTATEVKLAA